MELGSNVLVMEDVLVNMLIRASIISKEITGSYKPNCATIFIATMMDEEESYLSIFEESLADGIGFIEYVMPEISEIILKLKKDKTFYKKVFKVSKTGKKQTIETEEQKEYEELLKATEAYELSCSENLYKALVVAASNCASYKKGYVELSDLLYVIFTMGDNSCLRMVSAFSSFNVEQFCDFLIDMGAAPYTNLIESMVLPKSIEPFCKILNEKYEKGEICDILDRDREISSILNIISKKNKRNAILVGEPGVGKTAIVEAITQSIVNETCPKKFFDYTVVEVNVNSMIAGTTYRGQFEEKVRKLIEFVEKTDKLIIFIDEIHQIMGAGNSLDGGVDLAGAIKPLLSRDKAIFIGATTTKEYNKYFEHDGALKRRFETVYVDEPKLNALKRMIRYKVNTLSKYHDVHVSNEVLDYVISCGFAFNFSSSNPDRTIDLLDKSLAVASMANSKSLRRCHVDKVFEYNYKKLNEMKEEVKEAIAWHEAGHFVMNYLYEDIVCRKVILASIVPSEGNLGITVYEEKAELTSILNEEGIYARIATLLAGRIAESFVTKEYDAGARSDLKRATSILMERITEYGMDKNFENLTLCSYDDDNNILLTEKK